MPMEHRATSGLPGMGAGSAGFSAKSTTRPSALVAMTPKALASSTGTSMQATVMSASLRTWLAIISP